MSLPAFCNQCGRRFLAEGRYTRFCGQGCGLAFKFKADRLSKGASFAPTQTSILAAHAAPPGEWIGRHEMVASIYGANDLSGQRAFTLAHRLRHAWSGAGLVITCRVDRLAPDRDEATFYRLEWDIAEPLAVAV